MTLVETRPKETTAVTLDCTAATATVPSAAGRYTGDGVPPDLRA